MRDPQTAEPIDEEPQVPGYPEEVEEDDPEMQEDPEVDPDEDEDDLIVNGEPD